MTCEACGGALRESLYFCSPSCQSFWMQDLYGTRQDAAKIDAVTLLETRERILQDAEMYAQDPHTYAGLR